MCLSHHAQEVEHRSDDSIDNYCHYTCADRSAGPGTGNVTSTDLYGPADLGSYGMAEEFDELGNGYTEMYFSRDMAKCIMDDTDMQDDEYVVVPVYVSGASKTAVIKRESDLLTKQEIYSHDAEVQAATLEELKIWHKYGNFERVPLKGARNILDSRFVIKWKVKLNKTTNKNYRIIRMRMVMRGFKDWDADTLETYAGTASRLSQRLLASEVACHPGWEMISVDVEKAFLQGMTYK